MPTNAITAKQLQKAKELFEAATAHPTPRDVLENECRSDPELKALLERMIQADSEANVILDQPLSLSISPQPPQEFAPLARVWDLIELFAKSVAGEWAPFTSQLLTMALRKVELL
jgi:hypothetical protein